ncbi:MAG TPA: PrsW family glutamic-type intramembrane protease [Acidobacteriota bacterium]|nr:PrsW family glutamic-type intramembrane protease [Acidobacteriota bacterium]
MRLHLVVEGGSLSGTETDLEQGSLQMGRAPDCNLQFNPFVDTSVSKYHAIIVANPDGFYVADQKSTNGTLLNGLRVDRAWLSAGDVIQLGAQGPKIHVTLLPDKLPVPVSTPEQEPSVTGKNLRHTFRNLSYFDPYKDKRARHVLEYGGLVIAGFLFIIVVILLMSAIGYSGTIAGAIMAFIPAPLYLFIYLWMDRYDPEPFWALAGAFAWGGLFAVIISYVVNTLFGGFATILFGNGSGSTLAGIFSAPFIEEFTKGSGVVIIWLLLREEFDGVLDGIVYAGVIALGFATVENVLYYGRAYVKGDTADLILTGFLRGVLSPFVHALFTSMTGIGCGLARESNKRANQFLFPILGFCAAMMLHSAWNFSASLMGAAFFAVYIVVWFPLFLVFVGVIIWMANRERKIIKRTLQLEVSNGIVTQDEVDIASSLGKRMQWIWSSTKDFKRLQARRHFLRALTKLAFCYWHLETANSANLTTISLPLIPKFRAEIAELRAQV